MRAPARSAARNPRTAIGLTQDGRVVLVVVDGRQSSSSGMTMLELAQFMAGRLGVEIAMNLDGGGSSTMAVKGAVANHPGEGFERSVSSAVLVFQVTEPSERSEELIPGSNPGLRRTSIEVSDDVGEPWGRNQHEARTHHHTNWAPDGGSGSDRDARSLVHGPSDVGGGLAHRSRASVREAGRSAPPSRSQAPASPERPPSGSTARGPPPTSPPIPASQPLCRPARRPGNSS